MPPLSRGATAWRVGLRDPFDSEREVMQMPLVNQCLSSSAAFAPGLATSDILDPIAWDYLVPGRPLPMPDLLETLRE